MTRCIPPVFSLVRSFRSTEHLPARLAFDFPGQTRWSPVPDSNWLFRITGPAHRRLCLQGFVILEPMERIERSSVAYRATALPLSYIGLEPEGVFETPTSALRMRRSST